VNCLQYQTSYVRAPIYNMIYPLVIQQWLWAWTTFLVLSCFHFGWATIKGISVLQSFEIDTWLHNSQRFANSNLLLSMSYLYTLILIYFLNFTETLIYGSVSFHFRLNVFNLPCELYCFRSWNWDISYWNGFRDIR